MRVNWQPGALKRGDVIRVPLGAVHHYGIFVTESEVVQFGLPPVEKYRDEPKVVLISDIDTFACGQIVQRARFGLKERLRKRCAARIVKRAKARLGEGGYNIIHNNCEHFVYECALGVHYCSEEAEARAKWNARPICDVYIAPIGSAPEGILPPGRAREIDACANERVRAAKSAAWRLMQAGARRSLGLDPSRLTFRRKSTGQWVCKEMYFSLSHSDTLAAAAVSNAPVGVDIEETAACGQKRRAAMQERILAEGERPEKDDDVTFLRLWTRKESIFKRAGGGAFRPERIPAEQEDVFSFRLGAHDAILSVCGHPPRLYWWEEDARRMTGEERL